MSKLRKLFDRCRESNFIKEFCKGGIAGASFINNGGGYVDKYLIY